MEAARREREGNGVEPGMGIAFRATDPQSWDSNILVPGALVEIPCSPPEGSEQREGLVLLFIKELEMGDHGAWLQVKYIGASQVWLHEWAVKTFSRERQPVHVCRGGTLRCKVREERGHHVWEFLSLAPGLEPPSYVGRPKVREWRKLYADVMKAGGRPAQEGPGQDGDVQDRIARLKERLKSRKEGAERAPEERKEDAILQKRREEMIPPREEENDLKAINDRPQPDRRQRSPSMRRKDPENRRAPVSAAAQIARDRKDSGGHRRRRRQSRSRKRRRRSKSGRRRSGSSHSRSSSTSSSSLVPPLQKKAARNPGSVLKLLMTNVADALAQAAVTDSGLPTALGPTANQISSYFQIVARPQLGSKVRDCRELETLARCLDLLRGATPGIRRRIRRSLSGSRERWVDQQLGRRPTFGGHSRAPHGAGASLGDAAGPEAHPPDRKSLWPEDVATPRSSSTELGQQRRGQGRHQRESRRRKRQRKRREPQGRRTSQQRTLARQGQGRSAP